MKDFTTLFVDYNSDFESPTSFWKWSSYALVSSILRNSIYHDQGNEIIYPNIYVLLLADSGIFRKGGSFPLVTELLTELHNTKIYDGRASIQAILEKLSMDLAGKKGSPIRGGSCLLLAEELASFFVSDPQLIPLITNIYRSRKTYTYDLRGNAFTVKDLCVSMLAASNEIHLRDVYDARAVYGGLLGRTFLVKPDERREGKAFPKVPLPEDKKNLLEALNRIVTLSGQVVFTPEARKLYESWYLKLYKSLAKMSDPAGIMARIHTSVLKLAMVIAAAHYTMIIEEEHIEAAISQATNLKPNYETYVMGSGKSSQAQIGSLFLTALWDNYINENINYFTRKKFLMLHWNQVTASELELLVATLEQAGMVKTLVSNNEVAYEMSKECIKKWEQRIEEAQLKAKINGNNP